MNTRSFEETCLLDTTMLDDKQTDLRVTKDGYMVCMPRVARTGIQLYSGNEVGRPDMKEVRVYRAEDEVFSHDAVKSLAGKPVTVEHPNQMITADNWKDNAVGYLGSEVLRDGEFIRVPLHLMDAEAVKAVRGGKTQLSVGYTAELDWKDGVTPDGKPYDVKQTTIRANHVAITHTARGGPLLRMGDRKPQERKMARMLIDGIGIELEERDVPVVERRIHALEQEVATTKTALANTQTAMQTDIATARNETAVAVTASQNKDAEIVTLKKQLADAAMTPQKIAQAARDRNSVEQRAKALHDAVVITDDKSDADIRRQVVDVRIGDVAKGWTDEQVTASFNTLTATQARDNDNGNGLQNVVNVLSTNNSGGDPLAKAYSEYETTLANRWKTAGSRTPA
jgi:hypothetical protein